MPNGYAVVPNVLPGNVTIGGDLTIGGNTIRIGAAAPYTRVQKLVSPSGSFSYNLDARAGTFDAASQASLIQLMRNVSDPFTAAYYTGLGTQIFGDFPMVWGWSANSVNVTGTTAETSVFSLAIPGAFLGANGGLRLTWLSVPTVQGVTGTTLRVKFGGTMFFGVSATAVENWQIEGFIVNQNNAASQRAAIWYGHGLTFATWSDTSFGINTGNAQTLDFTIQPGAVTDNWNSRIISVVPVRCSG